MRVAYDLHLHSCLSPCGSEDMTPENMAAMCALAGLNLVALTDHNTIGNCLPFLEAAKRHGMLALPGMELSTREEVHVVCLFPCLESAGAFGTLVDSQLDATFPNDPTIFGPQIIMGEGDCVLGEDTRLLAGATNLGVYDVHRLVDDLGGVAFPAHIDRPSFSVLANLGLWDSAMGFTLAELSPRCPPTLFQREDLSGVRFITGCDAHYLDQIPNAHQEMELSRLTGDAAIQWLKFSQFYYNV